MRFDGSIGCVMDYTRTTKFEQKFSQKEIEIFAAKAKERYLLKTGKLEDVKDKIKFGKRLSFAEKVFVKIHAMDLYEKVAKIEAERNEFRHALVNCKTKEESQQIQISKSMVLQSETKCKEDLEFITMRLMAMLHEISDFTRSEEYDELPNE